MFKYAILQKRSLPHLALISALIYLLYVAISTIQNTRNPTQSTDPATESNQPAQEHRQTKQMDFLVIKDWHLFGQPTSSTAQNTGRLPETQQQLKLLGVFFLPDKKKASFAIIETEDHLQKRYRPGDALPGGSILTSIAKEQVILMRNEQPESLSMDREKPGLLLKAN